ncbi:MAG: hypothetical protein ACOYM0_01270 [Bacteroidales bacterium]
MLSLLINNKSVELPSDFSLTMNLKSPIFGDVGSYSYPFRIPNTPRNAIAMGFRHRVPSIGDPYQVDQGVFRWKGLNLFGGSVKMRILNSTSFEGNIFEGSGDFNYQVKNKSLQNYNFGTQTFSSENEAMTWINACRSMMYPQRPCAFPQIFNKSYFEQEPVGSDLLNYNFYWIPDDLIHAIAIGGQRTPIIPMVYLRYVLDTLIAQMGYLLDDSFFTSNSAFNKLVFYNSVSINNDPNTIFPYNLLNIYYNNHLPRITLSDFFTGLEAFFNIRFFVNNTTKTIRIIPVKNIVTDLSYIEFSKNIVSVSTEPQDQILGYTLKLNLDGDDGALNSQNDYEESFLKNLQGSVDTVSQLPVWPIECDLSIRYVIDTQKYYQMQNHQWYQMGSSSLDLLTQYLYRDGSQNIEIKFSSLIMGDNQNTIFCTCGNQQKNFMEVTPRLFFATYANYGDQLIVQGYNYDTSAGSLFFPTERGLFEKYYKHYLDFRMATKLVKIVKQMEFSELKDFDFSKKYMVNGIKYLVGSIQVTMKKDRIMPATLECYPCP